MVLLLSSVLVGKVVLLPLRQPPALAVVREGHSSPPGPKKRAPKPWGTWQGGDSPSITPHRSPTPVGCPTWGGGSSAVGPAGPAAGAGNPEQHK